MSFEAYRSGVYMIRCTITGKVYIGSSVDLQKRRADHFRKLRGGYHHSKHLQAAFDCYGEAAFLFSVIAYSTALPERLEIEQANIDRHRASDRRYGYNARPKAESNVGRKCSPVTIEKMRQASLGRKQSPVTIEKRTVMQRGRKLPKEWAAAISAGKQGCKRPDVITWAPSKFAKFRPEQVLGIRKDRGYGMTYQAIANKYGCSIATAHFAANGTGAFYSGCT